LRKNRIYILMAFFLGVFFILFLVLARIQLFKGSELGRQAIASHSQTVSLAEIVRGDILDRNQMRLTGNNKVAGLYYISPIMLAGVKKEEQEALLNTYSRQIGAAVNMNPEAILTELKKSRAQKAGLCRFSFVINSQQENAVNALGIKGLFTYPVYRRYDPNGFCAHILGYVNSENPPEGISGIEKYYNNLLKKQTASDQLISVFDAQGNSIEGLMLKIRKEEAAYKNSVVLTIDKRIQSLVENIMDETVKKGAVVVMDAKSGEILAMASRPNYSPYELAPSSNSTDAPFCNRALSPYFPGSLFKTLLAAAAVEEGLVTENELFYCEGSIAVDEEMSISCWQHNGHKSLNFAQAFANSCNPVFIRIGQRLGRGKILTYARKLHLSDTAVTGFNNNQSDAQISINPGRRALANGSLGQHGIMLTPLQMCSLIAVIADGGKWKSPSLLSYVIDQNGKRVYPETPAAEQVLTTETAKTLQKFMLLTVEEGTGKTAALPGVSNAGKTGTSQTGRLDENNEEILNTWFGGFYPAQNPHWAIVVLSEAGESGAQDAAPVFRKIVAGMTEVLGMTQ
jgi:peptidoglycan glycosyltransferase/penicillin-binding protein 2